MIMIESLRAFNKKIKGSTWFRTGSGKRKKTKRSSFEFILILLMSIQSNFILADNNRLNRGDIT